MDKVKARLLAQLEKGLGVTQPVVCPLMVHPCAVKEMVLQLFAKCHSLKRQQLVICRQEEWEKQEASQCNS